MQYEPPEDFDYAARAQAVEQARRLVHKTADARLVDLLADNKEWKPQTDPIWKEWHAAADAFHKARDDAYPPGFWESYQRLKAKDPSGLEHAVRFLEADPWFHRSGYIKSYLLRQICRLSLEPPYITRLQQVVLSVAAQRDGREFRHYCHLARRIDSPVFRVQLQSLIEGDDSAARRRAGWVLYACEHRDHFQPVPMPVYPQGMQKAYEQLQQDNPAGIDPAIAYLENNPWLPRHVQTKWSLVGLLARFELTAAQIQHLQRAALTAVDHPHGSEWMHYRLVAHHIDTRAFRTELSNRRRLSTSSALAHRADALWRDIIVAQTSTASRDLIYPAEVDLTPALNQWELANMARRFELVDRLQNKDSMALDFVLKYRLLLTFPRFPRTDVVLRQLVRRIARMEFTEAQLEQLREAALVAVEHKPGTQWWRYVPLLRKLDSLAFRTELMEKLESDKPELQARVRTLLDLLQHSA